jgi:hypothetical protein
LPFAQNQIGEWLQAGGPQVPAQLGDVRLGPLGQGGAAGVKASGALAIA